MSEIRLLLYTTGCYVLPALAFVSWLATFSDTPPAGCGLEACDSPRAHAIASFVAAWPRFTLALSISLLVALVLRAIGTTWRTLTMALAAAVVGGGLSTVLVSALTGEPIG